MHLLTHFLAGWSVANLARVPPKERAVCMGVSLLPDLDGLSLLGGVEAYQNYHHLVAHNITVGAVAVAALTWLFGSSVKAAVTYLLLFHLHLLMDIFGSGPGWGIAYFWPWDGASIVSKHAWSFSGWQNYVTLLVLIGWALFIAVRHRRTPLEYIAPRLDRGVLKAILRQPHEPSKGTP